MNEQFPPLDHVALEAKMQALDHIMNRGGTAQSVPPYAWTEFAFTAGSLSVDAEQVGTILGGEAPPPRPGFEIIPARAGGAERCFASNGRGVLRVRTRSAFLPDVPGLDVASYGLGVEFAVTGALGEALGGPEAMQFLTCLFMQIRQEAVALMEFLAECPGPAVLVLTVKPGPMAHHHDAFLNGLLRMLEDHERLSRMADVAGLRSLPPLMAILDRTPIAITRHPAGPGILPEIDTFGDVAMSPRLH